MVQRRWSRAKGPAGGIDPGLCRAFIQCILVKVSLLWSKLKRHIPHYTIDIRASGQNFQVKSNRNIIVKSLTTALAEGSSPWGLRALLLPTQGSKESKEAVRERERESALHATNIP